MALLEEQLALMAGAFPDETAYQVVDGGALTFRQWDGQANRLARGLLGAGLEPDDRVAIHLHPERALQWLVSYAGIHRAGGVAVPVNPRLAAAEVGRMLGHAGARMAIADGALVDQDVALSRDAPSLRRVVDAAAEGAPSAGDGDDPRPRRLGWAECLSDDASRPDVTRGDDDLADILYTSGTTGHPKGVAVRHANASLVPAMGPSWTGGGWLHASPMFTFAGLAFVYNPMKLGLRGMYQPRFDAGRWLEVVAQERPVAVFLVPSMTHLLLAHPGFEEADLSSVELCSVGSAPLAPFVLERLQARMPDATVSNNYGMTEAGAAYCVMPKGEAVRRPGSVGRIAAPAEVRVVGDDETEVAPGVVGAVRLRVPGRQREYFGDPDATAAAWVDGWLVTGDLGRTDDDGYLYIVGRSKDVIIRGGNNVHAADVEHAVTSHDAVLEAAVIGVPHDVLGEDVAAFVILRPGASATDEELRAHTLELLADYKVPRRWYFVEELPRNATGKVVKPELRRRVGEAGDAGPPDRSATLPG